MTLQDIITEVRQIVQQTDPNNSQASDAVITGWANLCTLQLCSSISTLPKEQLSGVVVADTITLSKDLLKMDFASMTDPVTDLHTPLETIDFVNFARINPQWEDQNPTVPSKIVRMTDKTWMLWPHPNTYWTGADMTIIGSVLPTPMSNLTDEPPVSQVLHPAYAHFCAWKFFLLLNNPERAAAEYATFDGIRKINTQTATNTSGSLMSFKIRGL